MSDDEKPSVQEMLHKAIQSISSATDDDPIEGAFLRNWIVIGDWVSPAGERWLTGFRSEDVTSWEVTGMLTEALDMSFYDGQGAPEEEE